MHANDFAAAFAAVHYARGLEAPDAETINDLLQQIHDDVSVRNLHPHRFTETPMLRKVASDALRDAGRDEEADLLAAPQRVRITSDFKVKPAFEQFQWPGGAETVHFLSDGGDRPLCANCANGVGIDSGEDVKWSGVHEEGAPIECSDCDHTIHALYGDPDNPDDE